MKNDKVKRKHQAKPIERHDTAAWASIAYEKEKSKVTVPAEFEMANAKDYVDENHK
ncbi:MAG: DUF3787 domain-containing protein [Firmicutes bacterium]|nr:DUF3787 domain-containing protein [Bacillota bacterium]